MGITKSGIKASIFSCFEECYEVTIKFITKYLSWSNLGNGPSEKYKTKLAQLSIDNLILQLKSIDLLDWESKYIEFNILSVLIGV